MLIINRPYKTFITKFIIDIFDGGENYICNQLLVIS